MPGFTALLLHMLDTAGDEVLKAALGDSYEKLKSLLRSKPVKQAIQTASKEAINTYRLFPEPNETFLAAIETKNGFLSEKTTTGEVLKIFSSTETPNVQAIAKDLADRYGNWPTEEQFTKELKIFFEILTAKLRAQPGLLSFFQAHDTIKMAESIDSLLHIEQSLEKYLISWQLLIEKKTENFTGREWIFKEVDDFISNHENKSGYFFILGDPGIGKSSLAAKMVSKKGWVHHFNIRREGINQASHFLSNICAQLIIKNNLDPANYLPIDTSSAATLNKILLAISEQDEKMHIVVVDALDEAGRKESDQGHNLLFLPKYLPNRVFFVVTLRDIENILPAVMTENDKCVIDASSINNQQDIKDYISSVMSVTENAVYLQACDTPFQKFIETFAEKSEYNFMYVSQVLPKIIDEKGPYNKIPLERLPNGLKEYYLDQWQYMKSNDTEHWIKLTLPVLVALSLEHGFISLSMIHKLIGDYYAIIKEDAKPPNLAMVRKKMKGELAEYIHFHPADPDKYRLYHESFYDFIREQGEIKTERLELAAMNKAYTDNLRDDFNRAK